MKVSRILAAVLLVGGLLMISTAALADITPACILVGDVDNYGKTPGALDQTNGLPLCKWDGPFVNGLGMDRRDAAEKVAVNGAQITDVYSALDPINGPNTFTSASVIIPIPAGKKLHDGIFTMAMGDFQATGATPPENLGFGPILMNFNGVNDVSPAPSTFNDGFQVSTIRAFVLSPADITAANAAGEFICTFDRGTSIDAIAFDWFKLCANVEPVPVPPSAILLGSGLLGLVGLRFRKNRA